jgi:hypothetical protein
MLSKRSQLARGHVRIPRAHQATILALAVSVNESGWVLALRIGRGKLSPLVSLLRSPWNPRRGQRIPPLTRCKSVTCTGRQRLNEILPRAPATKRALPPRPKAKNQPSKIPQIARSRVAL